MNESHQVFPDISLPKRALIGIQERLSIVGDREIARTVNGRAVLLQPSYGTLYAVELSNSGPHVWLPHRFQIGQPVSFASTIWHSTQLWYNETEIVLPRDAVAIVARDTESPGDVVPVTSHSLRSHSIPRRAALTTVLYRMRLTCGVFDFQASGSATTPEQSWTLRMEEIGG